MVLEKQSATDIKSVKELEADLLLVLAGKIIATIGGAIRAAINAKAA